jgi:hypothetical protein
MNRRVFYHCTAIHAYTYHYPIRLSIR